MIYFDNASTTRVSPEAAEAVSRVLGGNFGNPSSAHALGLAAEREIRASAEIVATVLNARPDEIYFTSGGTESNNLAIIGAAMARKREGRHIVSSPVEHPSVENALKALEGGGFEVTRLPVGETGALDPVAVAEAVRPDTILVSLMHVNNETGVVFDISEIGRLAKGKNSRVLLHTDGVQGFCKESLSLRHVDLYSLSAHKVHGAKGAGALFVRKGAHIKPIMFGGGQQDNIRPGTENVAGIASLGAAAEARFRHMAQSRENAEAVRGELASIAGVLDNVLINGQGSPYILNMSFLGVKAETLVHALEGEGVFISAGSACNAKRPGHSALNALGLGKERVGSAVRFSFSDGSTLDEAKECKEIVLKAVRALRGNMRVGRVRPGGRGGRR